MQSQKVCTFFLKGKCNKGDQCLFKHDESLKGKNTFQFKRRNSDGEVKQEKPRQSFQFDFQRNNNRNQQQQQSQEFQNKPKEFRNENRTFGFQQNQERNEKFQFMNQQKIFNRDQQQENKQNNQYFQDQKQFRNYEQNKQYNNNKYQQSNYNNQQQFKNFENKQDYNNNRNNYQSQRNGFQNNEKIICQNKVFESIQDIFVKDFIQFIYVQQFQVLGIVSKSSIIFYKIEDQIKLENKTRIQLPENTSIIYSVWHQIINNQLVLILCYGTKKLSLKSLAIYPNIWMNYYHLVINDVSVKEIICCQIVDNNTLLCFSNDGNLRAFIIENSILPPRIYNFNNPIESVLCNTQNDGNQMYYIGLSNGEILILQNGQINKIHHELEGQQYTVIDIKYDKERNKILFVFWHQENQNSKILQFDPLTQDALILFEHSLRISKLELYNNYVICTNSQGFIDILKFNGQELKAYSFYPNEIIQNKQYLQIIDFQQITFYNCNQVEITFFILGRSGLYDDQEQNISLLQI